MISAKKRQDDLDQIFTYGTLSSRECSNITQDTTLLKDTTVIYDIVHTEASDQQMTYKIGNFFLPDYAVATLPTLLKKI